MGDNLRDEYWEYVVWAEQPDGRRIGHNVSGWEEAKAKAAELEQAGQEVNITLSTSPDANR